MDHPNFEVIHVGGNCYTVNDRGQTVAIVTSQGYIDWLLRSPMDRGKLIREVRKETHMCYTRGLKLMLVCPHLRPIAPEGTAARLADFSYRVEDHGRRLVLVGEGESKRGDFVNRTEAELTTDERGIRYEWRLTTTITNASDAPQPIHHLEYNNVYPSLAGRCFLFAPQKQYNCTLMTDADGEVWAFPHQHQMHYGRKIAALEFAEGSTAGFFGESTGSPVVIVDRCTAPPDWAICDMYYDLHCMARAEGAWAPDETFEVEYRVKYLTDAESKEMRSRARSVPVTDADRESHQCPRLDLGLNRFDSTCRIDEPDDCSAFKQAPPARVWDREVGHSAKGSLRLTNDEPGENVWSAVPPSQIPADTKLNLRAMVMAEEVEGEGVYLRVRYHTFEWHPEPHVEWVKDLRSTPVAGTTPSWVKVEVPELRVPTEHFDYLVWIDVVLEGKGRAWVTDVDVDLQHMKPTTPAMEAGSSNQRAASTTGTKSASGSAQ